MLKLTRQQFMLLRRSDDRGFALIATLWTLVLLAIIAAALTQNSRSGLYLARNQQENAKAAALADAGIFVAIADINDENGGRGWRADGRQYRLTLKGGHVDISIQDEAGKIDLNKGSPSHLINLLHSLGIGLQEAQTIGDAIADYRDSDDRPREFGAEDRDYQLAGMSWEAKDAPFEHVAELHQVLGVTSGLIRRLAPFLTVYSGRVGVDLRTAPLEVLSAIPSMTKESAQALMVERQTVDEDPVSDWEVSANDTADRRYFRHSQRLVLSIHSEGRTASGASFVREAVVAVRRDSAAYFDVLSWRRGEPK